MTRVARAKVSRVASVEPPALDLINTHLVLSDEWVDVLADPDQRREWLTAEAERVGFPAADAATTSRAAVTALQDLRADVALAVEAARQGKRPSARALAAINAAAHAAPASPRVRWTEDGLVREPRREGSVATRLAATFAEAAIDLLASPDIRSVRLCEAPWCVVLFLGTNPRRRWCTPEICGNRARVARYYRRHHESPRPPASA